MNFPKEIRRDFSLKNFNTFSIGAKADYFVELTSLQEIHDFIRHDLHDFTRYMLLGGGSNVLFLGDYKGLVIAVRNTGIETKEMNDDLVWVTAQAGESWEKLVDVCTDSGIGGLQNLAMIPGNAGSAPIQNIGAYGAELKDVFHHLDGIFLENGQAATFNRKDCSFGYRDSIFKRDLKGRFLITSITLELSRNSKPDISYRALSDEIKRVGLTEPTIIHIRDIIKQIRRSKLPDPSVIGNAGSFFKNPVIPAEKFNELSAKYPDLVAFSQPDGSYKLAAGWLIEKCGWKGRRVGDAGVHEKQALVLVNYGAATSSEIMALAKKITMAVQEMFGIELDMEVNIIE